MPSDESPERQLFRAALDRGRDCPPLEQLERLLETGENPWATHVESCAYCHTELTLLRRFQSAEVTEAEEEPIRRIAGRMRSPIPAGGPWWKALWQMPWLRPAAVAAAGVAALVAIGVQWRPSQPVLHAPTRSDEVLRSNRIGILSPAGDLRQVPHEIQWQPAPSAVRYQVRLLEVDGTELWKAESTATRIDLPASVRVRIVPAKTLLCQVTAFDGAGQTVAESNAVRFRLLQNFDVP